MKLRRRSKAVENLRLANVRDYIITEDDSELSPFTMHPVKSGHLIPRRVNEDTYDDIMTSFKKFKWQQPKIDGIVLCDYRRFMNAMTVPKIQAIKPWVEWAERQLGWEKEWISENPVAAKREMMMMRFECIQEHGKRAVVPQEEFVAM